MFKRFRRLRTTPTLRHLVRQTRLSCADFIAPLFVLQEGKSAPIASMPGVFQMDLQDLLKECALLQEVGIQAVLLFGLPAHKDATGSSALREDHPVATATKAIKENFPDLCVIADLCFCEYTDHGHCGILKNKGKTFELDNDATLEILAKQAVILVQSGVDVIAPSAMLDGMVSTLRQALDQNGFSQTPIMSYSTKFASSYYGPFREAANSAPSFGDRKSYQMDFSNRYEAILESLEDEAQGADILMVKPALAYLDIVRDIKERTLLPLALYNVSGEYSMFKLAQAHNLMDYNHLLLETMTAFKRSGADMIISYHAKEVAQLLQKGF
ncbi:porphobilinogen synthase [Helicobacter ailurogastricus]|uniref:Delta-aminolevulinic acid dehydratase n=1 Tax=Helicobacter ailurogastricus TaxID=1578720 RepID=A0A0K2XDJ5_9HELI|nr:porphobilinogen synthase [Helicobacter ailurogastricus]CRF41750.1 Porphobilinogen synthase [Helicobacter ailurogastricus]CRF42092.1 Porphobilinogen synthase [Helicobacter ailurogastricus]CRF44161.1 Porphobilinogen synthase [Helicobacter ailurogastricus]CRF52939.1 Porphobilinogen synthase [Helicobacter ailurogastricus]BDQ28402.1 delta-aminolevulinic acid dehydratase [Helicobacter ailurogastricus]